MNRLAFAIAFVVITCNLNGCAVYTTPYDNVGISYGYAPYGGYGYYNHYGFGPRFYGGWGGDMAGAAIDGVVAAGEDVVGIKKAHPNRTTAL